MKGLVIIEGNGKCFCREYNNKDHRLTLIAIVLQKYNITNHTITIRPDDYEDEGENIEHYGGHHIYGDHCAPCVGF